MVGSVLKTEATFFSKNQPKPKFRIFFTLDEVTTGQNLFLAVAPLFEDNIVISPTNRLHYHEPI